MPPLLSKDAFSPSRYRALFAEYAISSNGFLPENAPLTELSDPYYGPWESLIAELPGSIENRTVRDKVDRLPVLSADHLSTVVEWRRAYVILAFIAHGYIWGGDMPSEVLPPSITVPLLRASGRLGLPPVATFASLNLWNFRSSNPTLGFADLDSLHALHTITGTEDESWFLMVSVAIEAQGAYMIPAMLDALDAVEEGDYAAVTHALREMARCIGRIAALLERMDDRCRPAVFYHRVRPLLAGSWNMADAGLPRGVFLDEGHGHGAWRQLRGGSNGQSSLIQFIDLVLGVEHTSCGNDAAAAAKTEPPAAVLSPSQSGNCPRGRGEGFHAEVRAYMPDPHRRFLDHVSRIRPGGIRQAMADLRAAAAAAAAGSKVETCPAGPNPIAPGELTQLQEAFQGTTRALAALRNKHLQIVARYIIVPARQPPPPAACPMGTAGGNVGKGVVNLATASWRKTAAAAAAAAEAKGGKRYSAELDLLKLTGTGGTALLPFLKQARDETFRAGEMV
ncbi:Indoleamine 2,3-dioxygenase [Lasiosphaeria miniovina]|uniref:Indoleamine 2,3-dioxygenase n=1 Tax=Lasiosphaeria miniovina TaxID=1954250 RepID=A0AA39ZUT6_9PEZI|nr:Indoleamine 2,3-dioxygenase [Lasiosphaeria miniovina]KAK0703944.1 Indoleamine 2,3-dioxygenase [Lasiosphaeria miniovina]